MTDWRWRIWYERHPLMWLLLLLSLLYQASVAVSGQPKSLDDWYARSVHAVTSLDNPRSFMRFCAKAGSRS